MKIKKLSNFFFNEGVSINSENNESSQIIDKKKVISLFETHGCVLFRGYNFEPTNYKEFTDYFSSTYANDTNDTSRRKKTNYDKFIRDVDAGYKKMSLHSEASFSPSWPEIVWFYCYRPAKIYGETTLCDGIKLWDILSDKVKNFFLANPLRYKLRIQIMKKNKKGKKRSWLINNIGSYDSYLNFKTGELHLTQIRFAMTESRLPNKLCFSNHVLHKAPYIDKTIVDWGTINGKKIPQKILNEVEEKSDKITYFHQWKEKDLLMLDNRRFMHGRNFFNKKDKRAIFNTQTLKATFPYGSTTYGNNI